MKETEKYLKIYNTIIIVVFFVMGVTLHTPFIPRKLLWLFYIVLFLSVIVINILNKSFDLKKTSYWVDIREVLLMVGMGYYWFCKYKYYEGFQDINQDIMFCLIPIIMYMYGKYYIFLSKNDTINNLKNIIFSLGIGLFVFAIISYISSYFFPYDKSLGRLMHSIMLPGSGHLAVTFFSFYSLIFISLISYGVIFFKDDKIINPIIVLGGVSSALWMLIRVKTRSPIAILLFSIILTIIIYLVHDIRIKGVKKYKKTIIFMLCAFIFAYILFIVCINFVEPIRIAYRSSFLYRDGGIFNNQRIKWSLQAVMDLKDYPLGGNYSKYLTFKQNDYIDSTNTTWGDIPYYGGIIPFASIFLWLFFSLKDVIKILKSLEISLNNKVILILPYSAIILYACTENIQDTCYRFSILLLFSGMIRGQILKEMITEDSNLSSKK